MNYEIKGGAFPVVELTVNNGVKVITEAGAMCWRDPSFSMETTSNGGIGKVIGRLFSGEKLFHNIYTSQKDGSKISFNSCVPGSIMAVEIKEGQNLICQKGSFLLAVGNVELSIHWNKKFGAGLFGGEGFIMQKISGNGIAFIEIDGSSFTYDLVENQKLYISTGHLVSMSETCQIDIESVGGLKDMFLGGEGFFNTVITGPGRVVVQSMPVFKLARSINPHITHPESRSSGNSTVDAAVSIGKLFSNNK